MRGDLGTFPENDSRASCEVAECRRFMHSAITTCPCKVLCSTGPGPGCLVVTSLRTQVWSEV